MIGDHFRLELPSGRDQFVVEDFVRGQLFERIEIDQGNVGDPIGDRRRCHAIVELERVVGRVQAGAPPTSRTSDQGARPKRASSETTRPTKTWSTLGSRIGIPSPQVTARLARPSMRKKTMPGTNKPGLRCWR